MNLKFFHGSATRRLTLVARTNACLGTVRVSSLESLVPEGSWSVDRVRVSVMLGSDRVGLGWCDNRQWHTGVSVLFTSDTTSSPRKSWTRTGPISNSSGTILVALIGGIVH